MTAFKPSIAVVSLGAVSLTEPDSGFPIGGSELQLCLLARKLARRTDASVTLYVADLGQDARDDGALRIEPLIRVDAGLRIAPLRALKLTRALARARHTLYITRSSSGVNGLVGLAARLARAKHLHMFAHDDECSGKVDQSLSKLAAHLHRMGIRMAAAVTCQSEDQAAAIRTRYGREALIVPKLIPPAPAGAPNARARFALWIGRDAQWKRPDLFLELARRMPDETFTLICEPQPGRDAASLRDAMPPNVEFHEGLPFEEAAKRFASHRTVVCTSDREDVYPVTFIQAAFAGAPILSLNVDAGGKLAEYGAGRVAGGDFDALVDAAAELARNDAAWNQAHHGALAWATELRKAEESLPETLISIARGTLAET